MQGNCGTGTDPTVTIYPPFVSVFTGIWRKFVSLFRHIWTPILLRVWGSSACLRTDRLAFMVSRTCCSLWQSGAVRTKRSVEGVAAGRVPTGAVAVRLLANPLWWPRSTRLRRGWRQPGAPQLQPLGRSG